MKLVSKRNFIILLAAILVVGFGIMSLYINGKRGQGTSVEYDREIKKIETQSDSSEVEDIEKDLEDTDLNDIDKELEDMEKELDAAKIN